MPIPHLFSLRSQHLFSLLIHCREKRWASISHLSAEFGNTAMLKSRALFGTLDSEHRSFVLEYMGLFLSFTVNYRKSHLILLKFCRLRVRFLVNKKFFLKKIQLHQDKQKTCDLGIVDSVIFYPPAELSTECCTCGWAPSRWLAQDRISSAPSGI